MIDNRHIYLANVGANSGHPFASPLFADGSFEPLPIPENPPLAGPASVRFSDLRRWSDSTRDVAEWVPERFLPLAAHADPEFGTLTYGDNCETAPRASALRKMVPGDLLFFIARLADYADGVFTGRAGFYLTGFLEIETVLRSVTRRPTDAAMRRYGANAHVRRGLNDPAAWDRFWVFGGSARSTRFERAVPVDRALAERVFVQANGEPWRWDSARTGLQVIGSYTRSCRCVIDPSQPGAAARAACLWDAVRLVNPGLSAWA